jgi:hypothetical protein
VPTLTTTTQAYTCTNGIQTAQGSPKTSTTSAGQAVCSTTTSETREYWQQPGGAGSVWNTPLGDGAVWGSANDADTQSLRHGGNINPADYFSVEIWTGKPSDPVETVTGSPTVGNNDNSTIQIHVPAGAYTSSGGDGNTDFWDATNYPGLSLHVGQAQFNGNSVTGVMTETDNAMSDTFGEDQETGLTGYDTAAGSITGYDMQQIGNGGHMRHMLRYATDAMYLKDAGTNGSNKLGPTSWPQAYEDWQSGINVYTGNLPAGTTVGIPMTTAMPANLTRGGQELFWTLQHYGALFRDQAGGGMNFDVDQIAQASSLIDDMRTDLPQIVQLLAPLRNQHVGGQSFTASPINGPGNRVDSGPPPLAPL